MAPSSTISTDLLKTILGFVPVPVLLVDDQRHIRWLNEAAQTLVGPVDGDDGPGAFGDRLGLDSADVELVLPPNPPPTNGSWTEFSVNAGERPGQVLKIRRRYVQGKRGECLAVLALEGAAWWDAPNVGILTGNRCAVFEATRAGILLHGTESLADSLRRAPNELAGKSLSSLVTGENQSAWKKIWEQVLEGHTVLSFECQMYGANQAAHPFSFSLLPVQNLKGEVVGVRGAAIDLESQKHLAYALEAAQERFNLVFEQASDPILILSLEGEILSANQPFERMIGIRSDSLFRGEKAWEDFVAADDVPAVLRCIEQCVEKTTTSVECRLMLGQEGSVWYEQRFNLLHDERGKPKGILAVARNIHTRKELELSLREEALVMQERNTRAQELIERLKQFFTRTSDLPGGLDGFLNGLMSLLMEMYDPLLVTLYIAESESVMVYARSGTELEKGDDGKPIGLPTAMCKWVYENASPHVINNLPEDERYRGDPLAAAWRVTTYIGAPLRDSRGKIRGTIAMLGRDPRPLESLDVELITVASLQVAARLRAEEEEIARRELEDHLRQSQKMEALGMLAGGVAHDFNNILSGILGFSSYLLNKVEPGTNLHRDLGLIETSAERASELTRQLLAFARRKHFPKQPVSIDRVVGDTLNLLERTLSKQIMINSKLAPNLPEVMGDSGQLHQVIMNLCLNASEAMSEKGGILSVVAEHRRLNVRENAIMGSRFKENENGVIIVEISDSGTGMNEEVLEHIFDPFFTTKTEKGGTGLGLSIVYGIVTNHGGDIQVQSLEEKGTTFRVYLPVWGGDISQELGYEPTALSGSETVLVVDDELIVRRMVQEVLEDHGYTVVQVSSGQEALDWVKGHSGEAELVLLDLVMPGMDGEETYHALREREAGLPILITSGYAQGDVTERLMGAGACGMVYKPYKSEKLVAEIRRTIDEVAKGSQP